MKLFIFIARRYLAWFIACVAIFALCSGCERLGEIAGSGPTEDVKLIVLDPREQPTGIFCQWG